MSKSDLNKKTVSHKSSKPSKNSSSKKNKNNKEVTEERDKIRNPMSLEDSEEEEEGSTKKVQNDLKEAVLD